MKIKKIYSEIKNEKLKNIVNINMGQSPSSEFYNKFEGFPFFQGVSDFGFKYPQINTYTRLSKKESKKGDILFSVRAPVGKLNISNSVFSIGRGLAALTVNNNYKRDYIYYILIQNKNNWKKVSNGSIFEAVNKKDIENFEIKVHKSLKQQENIAYVLSTQEEQIERIKGLIKKLEKRNQYYAEKLLSGELRIRENEETGKTEFYENEEWQDVFLNGKYSKIPNEWIISNFSDIMDIKTGKKNANIAKDNGKYLFFTCSKEDSFTDSYSFDQEAILVAGNGNVGHSKYFKGKFEAYQRTYVLGNFKVNGKYINEFIKSFYGKYIKNEVKGGVIPYIKINDLLDFQIILPKTDDIDFIMKFIETLNQELEKIKNLLSKEEKRFQWMLDNLLSGEYEVVED